MKRTVIGINSLTTLVSIEILSVVCLKIFFNLIESKYKKGYYTLFSGLEEKCGYVYLFRRTYQPVKNVIFFKSIIILFF